MQLPTPFLAQMKAQLGTEINQFLEALTEPAPTSVHFNVLKNKKKEENHNGVKWYSNGAYLEKRPVFTLDPSFHAGAYYVQEASSMLIANATQQLINLSEPVKVLDLCAAPGGKSTLLASLISPDSLLFANEVVRSRYQILDYNLTKWGISNRITSCQKVDNFKDLKDLFDLILVDAPCSGEGLFRKDPKAIAEWSPENVVRCSTRQKKILSDAIGLLKPGGVLLYSTCTYNKQENADNASWLLKEFPLEIASLEIDSDWGLKEKEIGYQCYPHLVEGEGFYFAAFRKIENKARTGKRKTPNKFKYYQRVTKAKQQQLENFINPDIDLVFLESEKRQLIAVPEVIFEDALKLSPYLRYFRMGTPIGSVKGKDLVPDPALALSNILHPDLSSYEVDQETAVKYLRKEIPDISTSPGWQLITNQELPLGWVKVMKDRINNYYPKEWRIRIPV